MSGSKGAAGSKITQRTLERVRSALQCRRITRLHRASKTGLMIRPAVQKQLRDFQQKLPVVSHSFQDFGEVEHLPVGYGFGMFME